MWRKRKVETIDSIETNFDNWIETNFENWIEINEENIEQKENKFEKYLKETLTNENILFITLHLPKTILFMSKIARTIFILIWITLCWVVLFQQNSLLKDKTEYINVLERQVVTLWNINEQLKQEWELLKQEFDKEKMKIQDWIEWAINQLEWVLDWIQIKENIQTEEENLQTTNEEAWSEYYKELE